MTGGAVRQAPVIARAGVVLAVLQFAFALTWIVYAAFLPALAAAATVARVALVASGAAAGSVAAALPLVPPIAWGAGALLAGALAVRRYGEGT